MAETSLLVSCVQGGDFTFVIVNLDEDALHKLNKAGDFEQMLLPLSGGVNTPLKKNRKKRKCGSPIYHDFSRKKSTRLSGGFNHPVDRAICFNEFESPYSV